MEPWTRTPGSAFESTSPPQYTATKSLPLSRSTGGSRKQFAGLYPEESPSPHEARESQGHETTAAGASAAFQPHLSWPKEPGDDDDDTGGVHGGREHAHDNWRESMNRLAVEASSSSREPVPGASGLSLPAPSSHEILSGPLAWSGIDPQYVSQASSGEGAERNIEQLIMAAAAVRGIDGGSGRSWPRQERRATHPDLRNGGGYGDSAEAMRIHSAPVDAGLYGPDPERHDAAPLFNGRVSASGAPAPVPMGYGRGPMRDSDDTIVAGYSYDAEADRRVSSDPMRAEPPAVAVLAVNAEDEDEEEGDEASAGATAGGAESAGVMYHMNPAFSGFRQVPDSEPAIGAGGWNLWSPMSYWRRRRTMTGRSHMDIEGLGYGGDEFDVGRGQRRRSSKYSSEGLSPDTERGGFVRGIGPLFGQRRRQSSAESSAASGSIGGAGDRGIGIGIGISGIGGVSDASHASQPPHGPPQGREPGFWRVVSGSFGRFADALSFRSSRESTSSSQGSASQISRQTTPSSQDLTPSLMAMRPPYTSGRAPSSMSVPSRGSPSSESHRSISSDVFRPLPGSTGRLGRGHQEGMTADHGPSWPHAVDRAGLGFMPGGYTGYHPPAMPVGLGGGLGRHRRSMHLSKLFQPHPFITRGGPEGGPPMVAPGRFGFRSDTYGPGQIYDYPDVVRQRAAAYRDASPPSYAPSSVMDTNVSTRSVVGTERGPSRSWSFGFRRGGGNNNGGKRQLSLGQSELASLGSEGPGLVGTSTGAGDINLSNLEISTAQTSIATEIGSDAGILASRAAAASRFSKDFDHMSLEGPYGGYLWASPQRRFSLHEPPEKLPPYIRSSHFPGDEFGGGGGGGGEIGGVGGYASPEDTAALRYLSLLSSYGSSDLVLALLQRHGLLLGICSLWVLVCTRSAAALRAGLIAATCISWTGLVGSLALWLDGRKQMWPNALDVAVAPTCAVLLGVSYAVPIAQLAKFLLPVVFGVAVAVMMLYVLVFAVSWLEPYASDLLPFASQSPTEARLRTKAFVLSAAWAFVFAALALLQLIPILTGLHHGPHPVNVIISYVLPLACPCFLLLLTHASLVSEMARWRVPTLYRATEALLGTSPKLAAPAGDAELRSNQGSPAARQDEPADAAAAATSWPSSPPRFEP